jgi:tRNA nucleotidyltransferase/poly(A) polymerase/2'-5' RNA ligase
VAKAKANYAVVADVNPNQWPSGPVRVVDRHKAIAHQQRGGAVLQGFKTEDEAKAWADKVTNTEVHIKKPDGSSLFSGPLMEFSDVAPKHGLRFVDRGRLFALVDRPSSQLGRGKNALHGERVGPASEEQPKKKPEPKKEPPKKEPPKDPGKPTSAEWEQFLAERYDGGKKKVLNTNPQTRKRYPEVAASTLLKTSPHFRAQVQKEFAEWRGGSRKTAIRVAQLWRYAASRHSMSKCMHAGCEKPPEREGIWADGRGRAWFCEKHFEAWKNEKSEMPKDIVRERRVPDGVVGEKYGEYPKGKTAKATGSKTGDGESVGMFIPLPKDLAKKFPSLGENDDSPSHVTFLYIGDFKGEKQQEKLVEVLRECCRKWWPKCEARLNGLEYFDHHDKDRRVPHVAVEFDKDLSGFKHRVKQELHDAGIEVGDSFPEYKPHVTLAYMPGMDAEWDGPVPEGSWAFDEMEVWGLPEVHKLKMGPSAAKVASTWIRRRVASLTVEGSVHRKNVALMKWLSDLTRRLGVGRDTYVVGGAVRNFLINQPIKDIDIVIDMTKAGRDSDWLAKQIARNIPAPTNVTTNQYGVAILTVKGPWIVGGEDLDGEVLEIANARKESYGGSGGKGYKPHSVAPATIEEDVLRREFTFNCMAGDTLIPTERGILRIDQIASREKGDHQDLNLTVAGKDGPAVAVGWQYSGCAPTLRVTTEWGHSFSCTHHHPVLVLRGHNHVWVQADQLEEGDLLCVPVRQVTRQEPLTLELKDPAQPKRGTLKAAHKPEAMTPELAFVIGCVVAEGSNTHKRVSFSNSDRALISRYVECFNTVFGFQPLQNKVIEKGSVRVLRGVEFVANSDGYDIYADSKAVVGWLDELGLYCGGARDGKSPSHHKVVPWSILQADERSQWAFLAAYLEGDGSIRLDTGRITFCSASPHVRQQLQALLGAHGVLSKVKDRFVYLNAVDSALLWEKIQPWMVTKGFDYAQQTCKSRNRYGVPKEHLQGFLKGRRTRVGNNQGPSMYRTDEGGEVAESGILEALRRPKRLLHDAYVRGDFGEFLASLMAISASEHVKLQRLFELGYQYVEVVSVEDAGDQDVFDISMGDGIEPAFVANGVVVHNTLLWRMLDLAHGPDKAEIIDLTGCGRADLKRRVIKCPQEPDRVFSDDPTRMLRAIKFTGKYGFKIPPDVIRSIRKNAPKLKRMPWEAVASILVNDVLNQPTARRSLKEMKMLGLLDVVSEMIQEQKPFAAYMANQLRRNRKVQFLLDLLELGVPASTPISFLDPSGRDRLRALTVSMPEKDAVALVEKLIKPPVDNPRIIDVLKLPGPDRRHIVPTARHIILQDPKLAVKGQHLTDRVIEELRR